MLFLITLGSEMNEQCHFALLRDGLLHPDLATHLYQHNGRFLLSKYFPCGHVLIDSSTTLHNTAYLNE